MYKFDSTDLRVMRSALDLKSEKLRGRIVDEAVQGLKNNKNIFLIVESYKKTLELRNKVSRMQTYEHRRADNV